MRVADSVAQAAAGGDARPAALRSTGRGSEHPVAVRPADVEPERKAELLRLCDDTARAAGADVAQVTAGYAESRQLVEVFNSDGAAAADDRTRVRLSVQVVARRDSVVETGSETRGGHVQVETAGHASVPPTVSAASRTWGWPTPAGTRWPAFPQ